MLRAILFDVDGTLVDSVDLHARAWQDALALYGKQVSLEKIRSQIGKGGDQLMPVFLSEPELARWGQALDHAKAELYEERYRPLVRPFPGVPELFRRIRRDGKRIVLASSGTTEEVESNLRLLGVEDLVDAFTTADMAERSKPFPDIFCAALERAAVEDPDEALVVGDSPYDVEAATRIALPAVGLLCGGFSEVDLEAAGAVALYASPRDLLDHYEQSPLGRDSISSGDSASP
ncbi:MAG: HAD family hydrolase [Myxococcales bacterium]